MTEQEYWDALRRSWYRLIRQNGYDLQYTADLLFNACSEMLGLQVTDPSTGLDYMRFLAHNIDLTVKWVKGKHDDKA